MATNKKLQKVILVESPSKAKTIAHYLKNQYFVYATKGHLLDLPKSKLGVDVEHSYKPTYEPIKGKKKLINEIARIIKQAKEVYLAQDPDREGEAIAWQVYSLCKKDCNKMKRIVFHEVTPDAIKDALTSPRDIDFNLVEAQQARRILDRLVGYPLSELLWHKIRYGLSAGRVQSAALRLIVERHREIENFVPEKYFYVAVYLEGFDSPFYLLKPKDYVKIKLTAEQKDTILAELKDLKSFRVDEVERSEERHNPPPPFITSTLQQEANRALGFSAKTTMRVAQELYQGLTIEGVGRKALITYMRTDSTKLSDVALRQIRAYIKSSLGASLLNPFVRKYKTRSRLAQEAHEAIRPTYVDLTPEKLKGRIPDMHWKLYNLIWKRAVATQMRPAVYESIVIKAGTSREIKDAFWGLKESVLKFPGFKSLYGAEETEDVIDKFACVEAGKHYNIVKIVPEEYLTKPPAYYTDATLVKKLEKLGIGRPSTFATIIDTLLKRGYVERNGKYLVPTDSGILVNDFLVKHFPQIVDYDFTAEMEENLDKIARGDLHKVDFLEDFYPNFKQLIDKKEKEVKKQDLVVLEKTDKKCPKCGAPMVLKLGRYGKFYSCSRFPECDGMLPYIDEDKYLIPEKAKTGEWILRVGPYGKFWAHKDYPKVKETAPLLLKEKCPKCGAPLVERKGKRGRIFIACSAYPKCNYVKR